MSNIIDDISSSRKTFFYFVDECNKTYRFGQDLMNYKEIIDTHRKLNNLEMILDDDSIYSKILETLKSWNMNQFCKSQRYTTCWNELMMVT